jgi:hypothetical protein
MARSRTAPFRKQASSCLTSCGQQQVDWHNFTAIFVWALMGDFGQMMKELRATLVGHGNKVLGVEIE